MDVSIGATIDVDCADWWGELERIWASIGYDEINWTYTPRGKALYRVLHDLAETPYFVRNHNGFTSGNGLSAPAAGSTNIYHEMPDGTVLYDWGISDQIYDTIVGAGFYPLIELGFLPRDMVPADLGATDWKRDVGQERYEADGLWKYPPKDYVRWSELVHQFLAHLVERYGREQVERWHFELWNEPDIPHYWKGTLEEYCKLYDYSVAGAMRALPTVRIGGPGVTAPDRNEGAGRFLDGFLHHCTSGTNAVTGEVGTRLDFVSFHTKGAHYANRRQYNLHVPIVRQSPSSAVMMRDIRAGLDIIAQHPPLRSLPVFVDECDPAVGTIYGVYDNPNFVITNTEHYSTFLCALVKRILDLNRNYDDTVKRITTWAFYMEGKRYFEGNRTLVTNENIEKPVLNAFRMLSKMGHTRLGLHSSHSRDALALEHPTAEVDGLAAFSGQRVTVLVWHQADEWWLTGEAEVKLRVSHLPFSGRVCIRHYRIDDEHSNAYAEWMRQGRPEDPSPAQVTQIKSRQGLELIEAPNLAEAQDGQLEIKLRMPLHATSLIEVEGAQAEAESIPTASQPRGEVTLTRRERFLRTARSLPTDRGFFWEDGYWPETWQRWLQEGMPEAIDFGFDCTGAEGSLGLELGYLPPWRQEVIADEGEHQLIRDVYGIIRRVAKSGRADIAQYVSFPVASRQDWEAVRTRLDPAAQGRLPAGWSARVQALKEVDHPVTFGSGHLCGFFSFLRELFGDEEVYYLLYDDPGLADEILDFQVYRLTTLLERVAREVPVDRLLIWEDMCYKNGPLIGPDMFRRFLMQPYRRTIEFARARGVQVFDVDSDGNVTTLIPLWLEAGVNMLHPLEVQSGMDVNTVKKQYGNRLALRGGIDKRELAKDRAAIDRELERIRPAYEAGGYIPCADHTIPPDVSFDNYLYYLERRALLVGKVGRS